MIAAAKVVGFQYSADGGEHWYHAVPANVSAMRNDARYKIRELVTHADYQALDQKFQDVRVDRDMWRDEFKKAEAELASLRAKVGDYEKLRDAMECVVTNLDAGSHYSIIRNLTSEALTNPTHQDPGHE